MSILLSCLIQFAEAWIVFIFDERWSIFVQIINLFESFLGDCTRDLLSFDDWFRKYILIFSVYRQLVDFSFTAWPLKSSADCWKIRMPESVVIEVPVKSPVQGTKSPAQVRLESRANEPRSPLSPAALKQNLENAELNRKVGLFSLCMASHFVSRTCSWQELRNAGTTTRRRRRSQSHRKKRLMRRRTFRQRASKTDL